MSVRDDRVLLATSWVALVVVLVLVPALVILWGMPGRTADLLITTLSAHDRFNHGDAPTLAAIAFYGWVIVDLVSLLLVGAARACTPLTPADG